MTRSEKRWDGCSWLSISLANLTSLKIEFVWQLSMMIIDFFNDDSNYNEVVTIVMKLLLIKQQSN